MPENQQLLAEYVKNGSETAFRELVDRYIDLVYSSAVRLVDGDTHLAQDVSQTVFADLARMARTFSADVMLGGWLHRHTCFVASKIMRGERRRQNRERQAVEMNAFEDHSAADLKSIAPILDDAINQLDDEDRKAILLRFFDEHDFRSVGRTLGSSEEAARKRVNRALEKLHVSLSRRGVALSAAALGSILAAQAVSAAPAGIAAGIATTALASAATGGSLTLTVLKFMSMTKAKVAVAGALLVAAAVPYVFQHNAQSKLREENDSLRQRVAQTDQLIAENDRLAKLAAATSVPREPAPTNDQFRETLKLRGEVGRLRQENRTVTAAINEPKGPSVLSGMTANPEMLKAIRDQQKVSMRAFYEDFTDRVGLSSEQSKKFVDLLVDHIAANIEHIQSVLRERAGPEERDRLFAAEEAALHDKLQGLLGADGVAQYEEYTRNLASHFTAKEFKQFLTGEDSVKEAQSKQLFDLMQEETQRALQSASLGPDYQLMLTLSPRSIASEAEAERNLKLLDAIYGRVSERAVAFLTPEELKEFTEFRNRAINNNRVNLAINRKMMAPNPK